MSTEKFTPGPWCVYNAPDFPADFYFVVANEEGTSICDASPGSPDITWDAAKANVRLIAAAPELLEALRLAQDAMRAPIDDWKGEREREALDAARAAITKATQ